MDLTQIKTERKGGTPQAGSLSASPGFHVHCAAVLARWSHFTSRLRSYLTTPLTFMKGISPRYLQFASVFGDTESRFATSREVMMSDE